MRARKTGSNADAFLVTYQQAADRYNLGLTTIQRVAKDCGAVRHYGRSVRVVVGIMDKYFMSLKED